MSRPADAVWYLYGVVPAPFDLSGAPVGLDDAPIQLEGGENVASPLAALVSVHDPGSYSPGALERNSADVAWLGPRARAHDEVLTWASDHSAVVPMPMFTLFSGRDALVSMLRDRKRQLAAALDRAASGREYVLRVYRIDAELLQALDSGSPRLAELRESAGSASPGQRYLLERKLEAARKDEARTASQRTAIEIFDALMPLAAAAARTPAAPGAAPAAAGAGMLILDAAFLVAPGQWSAFQSALTAAVEQYRGRGFRFDFTGPWPPYHFVQEGAPEGTHGS